ncbi:MAG: glycoside hydrolase family 3 N-terminal domain-containing protein [Paludibacter sp.]|nr:glycoside hydrolase family 3 N-terminal domain-containing protein [Paludibacter sp.]
MKHSTPLIITLLLTALMGFTACSSAPNETDERVEKLLSEMTLEEKVGQMTQITLDVIGNGETVFNSGFPFELDTARLRKALVDYHVGSVLNTTNNYAMTPEQWYGIIYQIQEVATKQTKSKIPVIYGVDAIHGVTYTDGATMFPQQITVAASFNPQHAYTMGAVTAYEMRASGIPWNFSPVLDLGADPRFSRQFEGFGEDPYLISVLGEQLVKGYEGMTPDSIGTSTKVASCLKHFLGYSVPVSGKDRTPAYIPDNILREYHLEPFKKAIEAGASSLMVNSGIINGVTVHASYDLLTTLLKEELGFKGVVVTDWNDIINLHTRDKIAGSNKEAVKLAINAGIDMSMVPYHYEDFFNDLVALVKEGEVKESRIDDAVRRILTLKIRLGLFETPVTHYADYPEFGSEKSAKLAYDAAADAITLLKNEENILPLSKDLRVLVTGPNANSMRTMNGGWSYSWQGEKTDQFTEEFNTFLEAIQLEAGAGKVSYVPGVSYNHAGKYYEEYEDRFNEAIAAARSVDRILLFVGENTYTEKPGDLNDLTLSPLQTRLAQELVKTGKPVILILNQGRPRTIASFEAGTKAVINTYLPGNFGGDALADILYGEVNPSGKLPYTYPSYPNSIVNYYHKPSEEQNPSPGAYNYESDYNPQFEFGDGLSYTSFGYSNLKASASTFGPSDKLTISVDVSNTGDRAGKEAVLLFSSDLYASMTPDVKRLRRFDKISLNPGETKTVEFTLTAADLAFVDSSDKWVTEAGEFELMAGDQKITITYNN